MNEWIPIGGAILTVLSIIGWFETRFEKYRKKVDDRMVEVVRNQIETLKKELQEKEMSDLRHELNDLIKENRELKEYAKNSKP